MESRGLESITHSCLNQIKAVGGKFPSQEVCVCEDGRSVCILAVDLMAGHLIQAILVCIQDRFGRRLKLDAVVMLQLRNMARFASNRELTSLVDFDALKAQTWRGHMLI